MVIRQRAIQAEDKQERHHAILDAAERLLRALAGPHRQRGRRRRRGGPRQRHGLPLFPEQGRAAARGARAPHRRLLPRADRPLLARAATPVDDRRHPRAHPHSTWSSRRRSCRSRPAASASWRAEVPPRNRARVQAADGRAACAPPAPGSSATSPSFAPGGGVALLRHSYALILGLWQMSAESRTSCLRPAATHAPSVASTIRASSTARCARCGAARSGGAWRCGRRALRSSR